MICKSSSICYLFDFDGTLFGDNEWQSYWNSTKAAWKKGPYINPSAYDIRWFILTGRPRTDKSFIWLRCVLSEMYPQKIITLPYWRYPKHFKSEDVFDYKLDVIKQIFQGKVLGLEGIEKVFYMDNDLNCISHMNRNRNGLQFSALSILDFKNGNFNIFL